MKTAATFAVVAAASQVNAFNAEFMRGAQTGMFLNSEEQFEDYSCPMAKVAPQYQTYLDMALPMKAMMASMNQGKPNPQFEMAFEFAQSAAKMMSVFSEDYDGGEFCQGLLFAKDASKVVFKMGSWMMQPRAKAEDSLPEKKRLALEDKLI